MCDKEIVFKLISINLRNHFECKSSFNMKTQLNQKIDSKQPIKIRFFSQTNTEQDFYLKRL